MPLRIDAQARPRALRAGVDDPIVGGEAGAHDPQAVDQWSGFDRAVLDRVVGVDDEDELLRLVVGHRLVGDQHCRVDAAAG